VYRHVLGTDSKKDVLIYEELDDKFSVDIEKSLTQKFIFINTYSSTCNEVLYIDASAPETKPTVFINRSEGHLYEIGDHLEGFYILSNSNAPNKKKIQE
jgi:oligopeptidase B